MQNREADSGPTLLKEDHGVPKGQVFNKLQFESVNQGNIDLTKIRKNGFLIALTSLGCDQCKPLYPILENFHRQHADLQLILMTVGLEEEVINNIHKFQLTMPVVAITTADMKMMQTGYFPFIYYLSPRAEVLTKSLVFDEEQFALLLERGMIAKTA
ncbi:hypothetical protein ACE3MQ_13895 [Paenibacillus lentus]|uniref:hypothetical protein n=1 Tax=Paenibacillus lentus TaxID=1338368 RepID=UPI00365FFD3C